jgi:hypothetical protein
MLGRSSLRMLAVVTAVGVSTASCSDATGPRVEVVAGTYWAGAPSSTSNATVGTFTTTENGVTTNMLDAGAWIGLVLSETGQTIGRLFVPGEIDGDLAGSWTLQGDVVRLSHEADTFLRDMEYRVRDDRLEAERVFDGVTVRVVLQRVP